MNTIDNPRPPHQSEIPFFPTALRYGLIGAGIAITVGLISNLFGFAEDQDSSVGTIIGCASFFIYVGVQIYAVKHHRDNELGGFITFGRAFIVALLVGVILAVVSSLFNYLYLTLIDPEMTERLTNAIYESLENDGMSEEEIEMAMSYSKSFITPSGQLTFGLIFGAVISTITGLIIAAVMKEEEPLA